MLILTNAIGNTILSNRTRSLAEFIARLLAVLSHAARGLIDIAFESGDLIRQGLFSLADLLLLVFVSASGAVLPVSGEIIDAAAYLLLPFQCLFSALPQLLRVLLTA